jgi:DNA-binding response OmpR family regulator
MPVTFAAGCQDFVNQACGYDRGMCAQIVLAEDDPYQADLIRRYLERERHAVLVVPDGRLVVDEVRRRGPDLLILDLMLPGTDGLTICRTLRAESEIPVLMLTARSTEDDLLLGLDLGADDYMTKPFSPRELAARIRTLLRRNRPPESSPILSAGALRLDPARHEVRCDGEIVSCTSGEFRLLEIMAAQPDRVFTRGQLSEQLRGFDRDITSRSIDMRIANLRKKIEPNPRKPVRLITVYGVGYKLSGSNAP